MTEQEFAEKTARAAGERLKALRASGFSVGHKGDNLRDIVTTADTEVNAFVIGAIREAYPDHTIYSEEGSTDTTHAEYEWCIDPIDGSSNFARGIPHFCVSIGLLKDGVPVAGAVYNPITDELFSFTKGRGAFLNGTPIKVSAVAELSKAQVIMSLGSRKPELWDWAAVSYRKLLEHSLKRCMFGSSGLDLCFIAAGRADAGVYGTLSTKDIGAAIGILEEAGGVVTDKQGHSITLTSGSQTVYMGNSTSMCAQICTLLES